MLVSVVGMILIAAVLLDVFLTVLDANGGSLFSGKMYRWTWWCWRHFARCVPGGAREAVLGIGAPLMIPTMIGLWTAGLVTGFALVYFGGLAPGDIMTGDGSQPSLSGAFRLSWVTLSTIGFVEISPSNMSYSVTVALEAVAGSIVLTLTITYYLSVHAAVTAFYHWTLKLSHHIPLPSEPLSAVVVRIDASSGALSQWLMDNHEALSALNESLKRYPIVYYFRHAAWQRSLPRTLARMRITTASLIWCAPPSRPGERCGPALREAAPAIQALARALVGLTDELEERYVPVTRHPTVRHVSYVDFAAAWAGRRFAPDRWVERFIAECRTCAAAFGVEPDDDLPALYARYLDWLPYVCKLKNFEAAISVDLGYDAALRPSRSSFWSVLSRGPKDGPQALGDRPSP